MLLDFKNEFNADLLGHDEELIGMARESRRVLERLKRDGCFRQFRSFKRRIGYSRAHTERLLGILNMGEGWDTRRDEVAGAEGEIRWDASRIHPVCLVRGNNSQ